ncbi:Msa family membrane protein [Streptococcus devriesei]|uniref:Msa family membrane protein n=1 Tax=Streptococcus devriesei TaxID=231233 RepID=UPI000427715F|nr:Msa family membrane protein [Streptococcus devriesei]
MIIITILGIIFYTLLAFLTASFLGNISTLLFIGLFYLLPLVVNAISVNLASFKKKKRLLPLTLIFPTLSLLSYTLFSKLVLSGSAWENFVERNSVQAHDFSVEISGNLLDMSQIIFVTLLYFSLSGLNYLIQNKKKGKNKNAQDRKFIQTI